MAEQRRPGLAELAATALSVGATWWYLMPEHEQELAKRRAVRLLHRASASLARREGRQAMAEELAGRFYYRARYQLAAGLSRARDGLAVVLDRMLP